MEGDEAESEPAGGVWGCVEGGEEVLVGGEGVFLRRRNGGDDVVGGEGRWGWLLGFTSHGIC